MDDDHKETAGEQSPHDSRDATHPLAVSASQHLSMPPQTRVHVRLPSQPVPRKSNRPSTASQAEQSSSTADLPMLPSMPEPPAVSPRPSNSELPLAPNLTTAEIPLTLGLAGNATVGVSQGERSGKPVDDVPSVEDSISTTIPAMPSPGITFPAPSPGLSPDWPLPRQQPPKDEEYDWPTFIRSYAAGRFDPQRTPLPPRTILTVAGSLTQSEVAPSPQLMRRALTSTVSDAQAQRRLGVASGVSSSQASLVTANSDGSTRSVSTAPSSVVSTQPPKSLPTSQVSQALPRSLAQRRGTVAPDLSDGITGGSYFSPRPPTARLPLRSSSEQPVPSPGPSTSSSFPDSVLPTELKDSKAQVDLSASTELAAAAATMRWAGSSVAITPLALPSPEAELLDPMRGANAVIPRAHQPDPQDGSVPSRKLRTSSFWEGTHDDVPMRSTLSTVLPSPDISDTSQESSSRAGFPAASAPLARPSGLASSDYFGPMVHAGDRERKATSTRPPTSDPDPRSKSTRSSPTFVRHPPSFSPKARSTGLVEESVPVHLPPPAARYHSQPQMHTTGAQLPFIESSDDPRRGHSPAKQSIDEERQSSAETLTGLNDARRRKSPEEQLYLDLGYLPPPFPPDEMERRHALYKFNVLHTARDVNFDRIAHLAKLVFTTKIVLISLVDGDEQWFKSESGLGSPCTERRNSFCAHSILQRNDEPLVVLDAKEDWRFANNPLVTGSPYIRFYAGAPLRTADGYNIGTLCIIDDAPRTQFTPRQRHTLKEFAAIVMREMELWRDKIQLRIRDRIQTSMERFTRECLEIDTNPGPNETPQLLLAGNMERVYERAAKLVKRTLDVQGAVVMDVSHFEVHEAQTAPSSTSVIMYHADPPEDKDSKTLVLTSEEYSKIVDFLASHPEGQIFSERVPSPFRRMVPKEIQYAMIVPIFNVDKHPFAILCAYTLKSASTKHFLEGFELVYLRAIGVIILSAVLKRRMILADKAKSLFISNISHELRTPLHGILAAAELLSDTRLDSTQASFLQSVQACGTVLQETVNHVLDFTKLSGNTKGGGVESVILPVKVDLMQLVEEAVEGCWIGARAKATAGASEIGSVYSPPKQESPRVEIGPLPRPASHHVETIVDIGLREKGWIVKCEKGGIRRVLMNLIGNSLKFTSDGFVHITLRELPPTVETPPGKIRIELGVLDTGKGISKDFLRNHLFHPFSQENPLQTGTGLGLAIVNSIVRSESVNGKVDVTSTEGVGTEIRVTLDVEVGADEDSQEVFTTKLAPKSISLLGFDPSIRGHHLLYETVSTYLDSWWGFEILDGSAALGDIVMVNEDVSIVKDLIAQRDASRPVVVLSANRGDSQLMATVNNYERMGGFCRIIFKPGGPSRLRHVLKVCLHVLQLGSRNMQSPTSSSFDDSSSHGEELPIAAANAHSQLTRRRSEEVPETVRYRPSMAGRSHTYHPLSHATSPPQMSVHPTLPTVSDDSIREPSASPQPPDVLGQVVTIKGGGQLLRSSIGTLPRKSRQPRVLILEDNQLLRDILGKWLHKKNYEFEEAVDGHEGVEMFESSPAGYFDIILLDVSMPKLNGVEATAEIRKIEAARRASIAQNRSEGESAEAHTSRIIAITGMSSLDYKRQAYEAGVDGYLVKPVSLKVLEGLFDELTLR